MRYNRLGRTGLNVPVLACGSNLVWSTPQKVLDDVFNYAIDKGVNLFVTSAAYVIAEQKISIAIGHRRDDVFIATTTDHRSAKRARVDIVNSFKIFDTDYIDIYMIGGVRRMDTVDRIFSGDGVLKVLKEFKDEGKIGHIGITGHMPEALAKAAETGEMDVVLFIFNMGQLHALRDVMPIAEDRDVGMMAMQPLGHGFFKEVEKAFRFVLSSPSNVVVSGMYSRDEIDENIATAERIPTEGEWNRLLDEAKSLRETGCRQCRLCVGWYLRKSYCPVDIDIPFIMTMINYRDRYGLSPKGEEKWQEEVAKCRKCDGDRRCEALCPYGIPIVDYIKEVVKF